MGILSRFSEIMKSNINALLDRAEDPEKMADQMLRNTREQFAEVKAQTASVMADAAKANRDAADCQADIARYQKAAENALISRNEGDAKKLIAQKQKLEEKYKALQQAADLANANADKMRQMYDKLASDIETLETRKDAIKAKTAAAKAQQPCVRSSRYQQFPGSLRPHGCQGQQAARCSDGRGTAERNVRQRGSCGKIQRIRQRCCRGQRTRRNEEKTRPVICRPTAFRPAGQKPRAVLFARRRWEQRILREQAQRKGSTLNLVPPCVW